ncbi:fibropellin-3-like [Orbicella faveolata]|uniref:fibropellin-3-like n=1 Tax=Orbicella faveolata TaxID=48498 RepID=UPI0009E30B9A|nr:fibropellin-3-like [Orbicella faveolata]
MNNPCQHGTSFCRPIYNGDDYQCVCKAGFTGKHCGVDINECASNPCLNGGACADQVNGYVCSCPAGCTGVHCQTEICSVAPQNRQGCGKGSKEECENRGCCYNSSIRGVPWCFYGNP